MFDWLNKNIIPHILKFVNFRSMLALRNGMLFSIPFIIVGSVFLLIASFPIQVVNAWIHDAGIDKYCLQAFGASFALMAIFATIGIAYSYVKSYSIYATPAALIALVVFILMTNSFVKDPASGVVVHNIIDKAWTGGQGMLAAIIIGLYVGIVYSYLIRKNITIKMPAGVPENIATSFTALIPAFIIILFATIIYAIFDKFVGLTFMEWIYHVIQIPLQGVADSFGGVMITAFAIPFLWFFGVHGSNIVFSVLSSILQSNAFDNQKILDSGLELTVANGGRILTQQFFDNIINLSGAGVTIGVVLYMIFFAKSQQFKELGKISFIPAIFNINEPVTFGTPIVMNPIMFVPFIFTPMLTASVTYSLMYIGVIPLFSGVQIPWTTPPIISGLLLSGWRLAVLQACILTISFITYYYFIRRLDNITYNLENETANQNNT